MITSIAALLAAFSGAIVPFLTGLLSKQSWAAWKKMLITVLISAGVGLIAVLAAKNIPFTWENLTSIILAVIGAGAISFRYIIDRVPGLKQWLYDHGLKDKSDQ
jgi:hypothetical protein